MAQAETILPGRAVSFREQTQVVPLLRTYLGHLSPEPGVSSPSLTVSLVLLLLSSHGSVSGVIGARETWPFTCRLPRPPGRHSSTPRLVVPDTLEFLLLISDLPSHRDTGPRELPARHAWKNLAYFDKKTLHNFSKCSNCGTPRPQGCDLPWSPIALLSHQVAASNLSSTHHNPLRPETITRQFITKPNIY